MNLIPSAIRQAAWDQHVRLETGRHLLLYLFLELTRRCNLRCRHCGSDCGSESRSGELDGTSWIRILRYLSDHASPRPALVLTGGEPLIHPGFRDILGELAKTEFDWGLVTNGFILDRNRLDELVGAGISSLTLSYDGNEETHSWLRVHPEAHARAIRAMELVGGSGIGTRDVVTCVFPANIDHLEETAERISGLGMNSWRLFRVFPKGRAAGDPRLELSGARTLELIHWIAGARKRWTPRGLDISFSCEGYLPFALDRAVRTEPFFCRSGINIASILCDGSVTGCNNNGPEWIQGSLLERDLYDIWNNEFKEYRQREWMRTGDCTECRDWNHCQGGSVHLRQKSEAGPGFCCVSELSGKG